MRHCPPLTPKHAAAPRLPSHWGGGTALHWGWVPPRTPAKVQLPCPGTEGCSGEVKAGKSLQCILALQLPPLPACRGVCGTGGRKAGRWAPAGSPSSAPTPWAASLGDFESKLSLETKPALNSTDTHLSTAIPSPEAPHGSSSQRTPTGRPTLWVAPGEGLWRTRHPVPARRAGRAAFPCLSSACYLETSELPAPASAPRSLTSVQLESARGVFDVRITGWVYCKC